MSSSPSPPSVSDASPWLSPPSPLPPVDSSDSLPPPMTQIAPAASSPALPEIAPSSVSLAPTPSGVVMLPVYLAPPTSSASNSIVSPLLEAAPSPTAISLPSSPLLPKPPSVAPPPLLSPPALQPPLSPSPSQSGSFSPPIATPSIPKVSAPPPPSSHQSPPTPPTFAAKPPPPSPPTPPTSAAKPPSQPPALAPGSLAVSSKQSHFSTGFIAGCITGGVLLLLLLSLGVYICHRNKRRNHDISKHHKEPPSELKPKEVLVFPGDGFSQRKSRYGNPLAIQAPVPHAPWGTFAYDELYAATNGFSEANLVGKGGFGYVHKGILCNGKAVAIKKLKEGSMQGEREFQAEVETISRVHHKHLVSLLGYSIAGSKRLLVYEYVPNQTLEFHLHRNGQNVMDWATRLKIAVGSAKGLAYIHEYCNPNIIHRDIKAANILLDYNFEAKVHDFGLAKSFPVVRTGSTHISTRVVGTLGYLAPEYVSSGKLTEKSDVYSYGVVLLELITGCPPIRDSDDDPVMKEGLVAWARPLLAIALAEDGNFEALVDPRLEKNYDTEKMTRMLACAAACVRHSSWRRPQMSQIVRVLEGGNTLTDLYGGMRPGESIINNFSVKDLLELKISTANWQSGSGSNFECSLNLSASNSDRHITRVYS